MSVLGHPRREEPLRLLPAENTPAPPPAAGTLVFFPATPPGRPVSTLWWLHPVGAVAMMVVLYASFPAFDYTRVVPNTYLPGWHYAWGACLLLALAVGAGAAVSLQPVQPLAPAAVRTPPAWAMALLLVLTLFAYVFWFAPLAANPQMLAQAIASGQGNVRNSISTTPGVTTMTQFGVAYVIGYAVRRGTQGVRAWETLGLAAVLVASVLRSIAWGERLAVIELVVCGAVAACAVTHVRRPGTWRLATLLPLLGPPLVLVAFAGTEYFRSWSHYQYEYDSIWQFSLDRLLAYYATASNNGIGLLVENQDWPQYSGRYVAPWLYMMPGVGEAAQLAFGNVAQNYATFLARFARPELNNASGLFPIVFDIGYVGSMLYFLGVGLLVGRLWLGWRRQELGGLLFYPPCVLFIVELLRINYLGSSRFFPAALGLLLLLAAARSIPLAGGVPGRLFLLSPLPTHRQA